MTRVAIVLALSLAACTETSKPPDDAGADSASEDSASSDTTSTVDSPSAVDVGDGDAEAGEYCPSPLFPPRTDGCPCFPPGGGPCTDHGKVCIYYQKCPGWADRWTCQWVSTGKQVPEAWLWGGTNAPCPDAGK